MQSVVRNPTPSTVVREEGCYSLVQKKAPILLLSPYPWIGQQPRHVSEDFGGLGMLGLGLLGYGRPVRVVGGGSLELGLFGLGLLGLELVGVGG